MSLSVPHSLPRSPPLRSNPPRTAPSFSRFPLFRCSANLRASKSSQNSRVNARFNAPRLPVVEKLEVERFASISSSSSRETSSVGVNPQISVPPPPSNIGSPLFWIGVGVGLSALFSWVRTRLLKYAMQQAFKTLMGQMNTQDSQFNNAAFPPGSPFPFPSAPASGPFASPFPATSQHSTVDVSATRVDAAPAAPASSVTQAAQATPATPTIPATPTTDANNDTELEKKSNSFAFVDVTPEETEQKSPFESSLKDVTEIGSSKDFQNDVKVSQNGAAFKQGFGASTGSQSTGKANSLSVEALEKMLEDPTVQKMVYPYLPEEMRNPSTFKWMLQNPQYRQQLEDMLNNMGGSNEWDNRMMDSLKNFDLSSPEVKQQFDQIGLTPEEVISKIMANPEVAMAFQNPRVQAAIMDCSQNPLSIAKYQNDKEVMDVFNKISELFPGVSGSP
ncbi:protein TIC 40 chloroplastic [Prunus yedoensis var. nudiflora]|uniref:Protein TIC 40, chloroplastic n=1 Tax=Prunus yedoensis var. nudiflora TaxID=2094558 RepID=A0A314YTS1_PRUYE|nr:protein TIC 40 chloroplastic [Prunus yedoensis var. nudiflora]